MNKDELALVKLHQENNENIKNATIKETWTDENGFLCVKYSNDEWYHYNVKTGEWW